MNPSPAINRLVSVAVLLAFCVIVLGAYVRLSDAGLGCPDWPGCYGQLLPPQGEQAIAGANRAYPERPVQLDKAWKEVAHRYLAASLGLLILVLAVLARRVCRHGRAARLSYWLVALVVCQGLLGMLTVTLLVKPLIVLLHLAGGLATLVLLWWLWLSTRAVSREAALPRRLGLAARVALTVLTVQILLGGWTSTNYAALSCPDFPTCQTQWWPPMDFADAFTLWRGTGIDYEGGVLSHGSRVAIHMTHRIGALVTALVLSIVAASLWRSGRAARAMAGTLLVLLSLQLALGIGNVVLHLPLWVATAHNGGAALLLLSLVYIVYRAKRHPASSLYE